MPTFTYFGHELAYAEEFPAFEYAEFCEALDDDVDASSNRATGVALRLAVACVAEPDRARFRRLSRQNRAKVEDWLRVFRDWTAEEAERPTGRPTDSSAGPDAIPVISASPPVASVTSLTEQAPVVQDPPETDNSGDGAVALALARSRPA